MSKLVQPRWHELDAIERWSPDSVWSADTGLSPTWRMFLLGDGSPTRHLRLLTGSPTEVDVLGMHPVGADSCGAPVEVEQVASPWLLRQVYLRNSRGERLGYAASWWNEAEVKRYLEDTSIPIWMSLAKHKVEIYREICGLCEGHSAALVSAFGCPGPFFGRHYVFWHDRKPLTLIYEVFSPRLERYLGPVRAPGPSPGLSPEVPPSLPGGTRPLEATGTDAQEHEAQSGTVLGPSASSTATPSGCSVVVAAAVTVSPGAATSRSTLSTAAVTARRPGAEPLDQSIEMIVS